MPASVAASGAISGSHVWPPPTAQFCRCRRNYDTVSHYLFGLILAEGWQERRPTKEFRTKNTLVHNPLLSCRMVCGPVMVRTPPRGSSGVRVSAGFQQIPRWVVLLQQKEGVTTWGAFVLGLTAYRPEALGSATSVWDPFDQIWFAE